MTLKMPTFRDLGLRYNLEGDLWYACRMADWSDEGNLHSALRNLFNVLDSLERENTLELQQQLVTAERDVLEAMYEED